ncbi:MAG: sigma-70 family RNA polymerase sigma factor [Chloroflexi bacterium]|nr:sigma-70 family RNA polymerase sigma factor [Chloroflexota bacterium]
MLLTQDLTMTRVENEPPVRAKCSSFSQFVQMHETAVFTFCYRILANGRVAEMVAETAFLDASAHFPDVSLINVLATARRRCRDQLQRGGFVTETAVADIQSLFNNLPLPEREALALRYGCKLNFDEIAHVLETSCAVVRATLRQGRWRIAGLEQTRQSHLN